MNQILDPDFNRKNGSLILILYFDLDPSNNEDLMEIFINLSFLLSFLPSFLSIVPFFLLFFPSIFLTSPSFFPSIFSFFLPSLFPWFFLSSLLLSLLRDGEFRFEEKKIFYPQTRSNYWKKVLRSFWSMFHKYDKTDIRIESLYHSENSNTRLEEKIYSWKNEWFW